MEFTSSPAQHRHGASLSFTSCDWDVATVVDDVPAAAAPPAASDFEASADPVMPDTTVAFAAADAVGSASGRAEVPAAAAAAAAAIAAAAAAAATPEFVPRCCCCCC